MRLKIDKSIKCDHCHKNLTNWDYRYRGKHYCRKCYDNLFHLKVCSVCNKKKKIYYALKPPVCKFCQVKDKPCIRCGKTKYLPGLITEYGAVCNVCSKYYKKHKACSVCGKSNEPTSNRTLSDGTKKLLCQKCYHKTLPVCSSCGYRRIAFTYTLDNKPLCKICSIEKERNCIKCGRAIPAGSGNICKECSCNQTLDKKVNFISKSLSVYTSDYFIEFSKWLKDRRGVLFSALKIQKYQKYFFNIDNFCIKLNGFPSYEQLLQKFDYATSKEYFTVHQFFDSIGVIKIDKEIKDKYYNQYLIRKYLKTFEKGDYRNNLIHKYYKKLLDKLESGKTTIHSIRLSLTPAVRFLKYCDHFKEKAPNMNILEGYLWIYPGQKNSLTEFANFLSRHYSYKINIRKIEKPAFEKAHENHELLYQRIIQILNKQKNYKNYYQYLFKILIGYLHNIHVPDNVYVDLSEIKKDKQGDYYIKMCGEKFYLGECYKFLKF